MKDLEIYNAEQKAFKAGVEYQKEQMYTKDDLETAWKSSSQNMHFQFSSSAYRPITFEQWYNSFKELNNE
jgi:hypothetical protein